MRALPKSRLLRSAFLLLVTAAFAHAQIPGGMNEVTKTGLGGNNSIVGTVFLPSGRPVDFRLPVRLSSRARGDILSSTDDRGQFIFSGVAEGQYTVVIDSEKDFQPVSYNVDVAGSLRPGGPSVPITVSIRLTSKPGSDARPAVIHAEDAAASKRSTALYKEALDLIKAKQRPKAIEKLREATEDSPKYISAYMELGAQLMLEGELEKAEGPLLKAVEIEPTALEPLVNLGILYFRTMRYRDSLASLIKANKVNGEYAVTHFYLGRTLIALKQPDLAIKEFQKTISLSGDEFKESHRLLARLYFDKGEKAKGVQELETYLKLVPNAKDADELRMIIKQNKN